MRLGGSGRDPVDRAPPLPTLQGARSDSRYRHMPFAPPDGGNDVFLHRHALMSYIQNLRAEPWKIVQRQAAR